MSIFVRIFSNLFRTFKRYSVPKVLIILVFIMIAGSVGILLLEEGNQHFETFQDGLWWTFVTITTVGYGDKYPVTLGGMILAAVIMVAGIGFIGILTATIASVFVEGALKEDMGLSKMKVKKHIIICGWNSKAREIIAEFQSVIGKRIGRIGVVANLEAKPIDDWTVFFIRGDYSSESVLRRANIEKAETVIILSDQRLLANEEDADAKAILTALTIKSINPSVYVCMELLDPENRPHGERVKADEIIVSSEMSSRLLCRSAMDHGISKFYSEIITSHYGNELYKVPLPQGYAGKTFDDLFIDLRKKHNAILLGVERIGNVITNPDQDYSLASGDNILVIAHNRPELI